MKLCFWLLMGTHYLRPAVESFKGRLSRAAQKKLQSSSHGMYSKDRLPDGRVRVTGGKRLKASGAYSTGFSKKVAKLMKHSKFVAWF
jgi:hypothetical protein